MSVDHLVTLYFHIFLTSLLNSKARPHKYKTATKKPKPILPINERINDITFQFNKNKRIRYPWYKIWHIVCTSRMDPVPITCLTHSLSFKSLSIKKVPKGIRLPARAMRIFFIFHRYTTAN